MAMGSLAVASTLDNLGTTASQRGDLTLAAEYYKRALEIREAKAPDSLVVAGTLNNLGNVLRKRGHMDLATEYFQRALK